MVKIYCFTVVLLILVVSKLLPLLRKVIIIFLNKSICFLLEFIHIYVELLEILLEIEGKFLQPKSFMQVLLISLLDTSKSLLVGYKTFFDNQVGSKKLSKE